MKYDSKAETEDRAVRESGDAESTEGQGIARKPNRNRARDLRRRVLRERRRKYREHREAFAAKRKLYFEGLLLNRL